MMRTLGMIVAVVCIATVLTEALAVAYLAATGRLTNELVANVRAAVSGEETKTDDADKMPAEDVRPSTDEIVQQRIGRVWELDRRQKEVALLKAMIFARAGQLSAREERLTKQQQALVEEWEKKSTVLQSASTEQARAILAKLTPADAVANLMSLDLDRNVVLLKGMSERLVAEFLQEFLKSADKKVNERGRRVFEAISRGEPQRKTIKDGLKKLQPGQPE